jgi:hypothetical protein
MHNTKESLEHFLLQSHHNEELHQDNHHGAFSVGMFLLIGAGISATCLSCVGFRNHENFVKCKVLGLYINTDKLKQIYMY